MSKHHHEHDCDCDNKKVVKLLEEILKVEQWIHCDVHELVRLAHQPLTAAIAVQFTGGTVTNNALVFKVGETSQMSILPLLADGTTPSGGVVSNVAYNFNDPSATVVMNSDGLTATATGVAASQGPIGGNATCTVTDTNGAISQWDQGFTIQTNGGVLPDQITQSVAVQFSDPVAGGTLSSKGVSKQTGKAPLNE